MTGVAAPAALPMGEIAELCRRYRVAELSLFGSALRDDFRAESDVDLLVEFETDAGITFIRLGLMEEALEGLLDRPVDVVPQDGLKPRIRDAVLALARVLCGA